MPGRAHTVTLHGSAVAIPPFGLLILGAAGAGKSSLALELMALGATLVADDRVEMQIGPDGAILMRAPESLDGLIEARGVGLLSAPASPARLSLVVDLGAVEDRRLPERLEKVIEGVAVPCLRKVESPAFAAMLIAYLKGGRVAP